MSISEIQLYQILKNKLGEQEAESLVAFVKEEVKTELEVNTFKFATKEDILRLDNKITEVKAELLKSVYIVGLIQFLAIVGSVVAIVNFMLK